MGVAVNKNAQCKRCGSIVVAWVQSKRTERWYLAFATQEHSIMVGSQSTGRTGWVAHPQSPHKCDNPVSGGYRPCPLCGRCHVIPMGATPEVHAEWCAKYPNAPQGTTQ